MDLVFSQCRIFHDSIVKGEPEGTIGSSTCEHGSQDPRAAGGYSPPNAAADFGHKASTEFSSCNAEKSVALPSEMMIMSSLAKYEAANCGDPESPCARSPRRGGTMTTYNNAPPQQESKLTDNGSWGWEGTQQPFLTVLSSAADERISHVMQRRLRELEDQNGILRRRLQAYEKEISILRNAAIVTKSPKTSATPHNEIKVDDGQASPRAAVTDTGDSAWLMGFGEENQQINQWHLNILREGTDSLEPLTGICGSTTKSNRFTPNTPTALSPLRHTHAGDHSSNSTSRLSAAASRNIPLRPPWFDVGAAATSPAGDSGTSPSHSPKPLVYDMYSNNMDCGRQYGLSPGRMLATKPRDKSSDHQLYPPAKGAGPWESTESTAAADPTPSAKKRTRKRGRRGGRKHGGARKREVANNSALLAAFFALDGNEERQTI